MKIERQMAWPCRDCAVRDSSFCGVLMGHASSSPSTTQKEISQVFVTASKHEVIRHDENRYASGPFVLCKGWAYRYHRFSDGRRQILSILVPGDLFFLFMLGNVKSDFSVRAATEISYCQLGRDDTRREIATNPAAFDAFGELCSVESDESVAAAVNFNESNSVNRIVVFMQRLVKRLNARGIAINADVYPFPLTHNEIADATGLATDDVNRAIQYLRDEGVVDLSNGQLTIIDSEKFANQILMPVHHASAENSVNTQFRLF